MSASPFARWMIEPCVLVLAILLGSAGTALAHDPGLSRLALEVRRGEVAAHLVLARREIEWLVPMDADGDGAVSRTEFAAARVRLQALATSALEVTVEGRPGAVGVVAVELDQSDALHARLVFPVPAPRQLRVHVPLISRLAVGHRQYAELRDADGRLVAGHILQADRPGFSVEVGNPPAAGRTFREFFALGVEHILTGADHLLFLLALLLVGPGLGSAARVITSFTVAHSITLALATFALVRLAPSVVEPLIALSVLYVGAENLLGRGRLEHRWILTFAFGLVHGLGFATALRDLGVGAAGGGAVLPLLAFNLGVEAGQLAVAAPCLSLIWWLQRCPRAFPRLVAAGSVLVVLAGASWFVQRAVLSSHYLASN